MEHADPSKGTGPQREPNKLSRSLAHQAQLKRLQELLVHKIKIEAAMAKELASLRTGYEAHAKDLQTCINRRTKELM
jgi:hypothetical protein